MGTPAAASDAGILLFGTLAADVLLRLLSLQACPVACVQSRHAVGG